MGPKIERFDGYVPYTWMADTIIEPDRHYKLNPVRLFGYPLWICAKETGVSTVMWSNVLNGKKGFSDAMLSHVCDRFAIPASLVKDLCRFQKIEWLRRNGLSNEPCKIPSHYSHYFEEIDLAIHSKLRRKDSPVMQARYAQMRKNKELLNGISLNKGTRVEMMKKYMEERDAERRRLEAEALAAAEAGGSDRKRSRKILPRDKKRKPAP